MDQEIQNLKNKIEEQGAKIDAIYKSLEKIRKYFLIMTWVTIVVIVLPIVALIFVIPMFLNSYVDGLSGLGL